MLRERCSDAIFLRGDVNITEEAACDAIRCLSNAMLVALSRHIPGVGCCYGPRQNGEGSQLSGREFDPWGPWEEPGCGG